MAAPAADHRGCPSAPFGGFQGARLVHFLAMSAIAGFIAVHVVMALIVPKTIRAMVFGR